MVALLCFLVVFGWVLGFYDDETSRTLEYLYSVLAEEIEQLKTLMSG